MIADALKLQISLSGSRVEKIAKATGITKLGIGGTLEIDLEKVGKTKGMTCSINTQYTLFVIIQVAFPDLP